MRLLIFFVVLVLIILILLPKYGLSRDCSFESSAYLEYSNGTTAPASSSSSTSSFSKSMTALKKECNKKDATNNDGKFCVCVRFRFVLDKDRSLTAIINYTPNNLKKIVQALTNETYASKVEVTCKSPGLHDFNTTLVQSVYECCESPMCNTPYFNGTNPFLMNEGSRRNVKMNFVSSIILCFIIFKFVL